MTGYSFVSKTSRLYIFILLCFNISAAHSQETTFSLQDLVKKAVHYSPSIQSKNALVKSASSEIQTINDDYLPTAIVGDEALIGSDNSLPGSYLSMGLIPSTSAGIRSSNKLQPATTNFAFVQSTYEIASFGYKDARLRNAEALIELKKDDLGRDKYLLKWKLSKLYFELRKQQLQVSIEEQNVKRNQKLFTVIRAIAASGMRPGADSSQALAELSKTKVGYNNALRQASLLKQQLSYLTGISADSIVVDTTETKHQIFVTKVMNGLSDSVNNPIIYYYKTKVNQLYANEQLIKKSFNPHLMVTAMAWARGSSIDYNDNYKSLFRGLGYQRYNYMAGLSISYNLFNNVYKRDKLATNSFEIDANHYSLQQQEQDLDNINKQADEIIKTASDNLAELPVQLKAATDAFNQKTAQYKAGIINLVDLTNATYVLYRAQTDYAQALNEWFLANVDKAAATGNLDLFIQSLN